MKIIEYGFKNSICYENHLMGEEMLFSLLGACDDCKEWKEKIFGCLSWKDNLL